MIDIRPARDGDVSMINDLFNALIPTTTVAWRDHLETLGETEAWLIGHEVDRCPVFVADIDGTTVGYTCWSTFRGGERFPGYRHTVEHTVHVHRDYHGRGIGRALLTELIAEADRREVHVMVAGIDGDNFASQRFHAAMGFTEVARMPQVGRKFERWLDLILMQRILR